MMTHFIWCFNKSLKIVCIITDSQIVAWFKSKDHHINFTNVENTKILKFSTLDPLVPNE